MIDFNFQNNETPKKGSLLISEPFLIDTYFSRSVIFLCDHNKDGSFGFVLNKFVENDLSTILEDFPSIDIKLSVGGPVDTSNLFFVHSLGDLLPESIEICDNVFIGGNFDVLKEVIRHKPETLNKVRFFIGYSGWSEQQLDQEIDEKSWIVVNNYDHRAIFETDSEMWKHTLEKAGEKFKIMTNFPNNPSHN